MKKCKNAIKDRYDVWMMIKTSVLVKNGKQQEKKIQMVIAILTMAVNRVNDLSMINECIKGGDNSDRYEVEIYKNSIENLIWTFKNDVDPFPERLPNVQQQLSAILRQDLPEILRQVRKNNLTVVCSKNKKFT